MHFGIADNHEIILELIHFNLICNFTMNCIPTRYAFEFHDFDGGDFVPNYDLCVLLQYFMLNYDLLYHEQLTFIPL